MPNRVFTITFVFFLFFMFTIVSIAQSQFFGQIISDNSSKLIKREYGVELSFERFKLSLFPLRTTLVNVEASYKGHDAEIAKLSVEFGLEDIFANNLSIGELKIANALINIKKIEIATEQNKDTFPDLSKIINENLPMKVRRFGLERVKVFYDDKSYDISKTSVEIQKNRLHLFGRNILKSDYWQSYIPKSFHGLDLDEVTYDFYIEKKVFTFNELVLKSEDDFFSFQGVVDDFEKFDQCFWEANLNLARYNNLIAPFIKNLNLKLSGDAYLKGEVIGTISDPKVLGEIELEDFNSKFIDAKKALASVAFDRGILNVSKLKGTLDNGTFEINKEFKLFEVDKPQIYIAPEIYINNVSAYEVLKAIPVLNGVSFNVSGLVKSAFTKKDIKVTFIKDVAFTGLSFKKNIEIVNLKEGKIKDKGSLTASFDGELNLDLQISDDKTNLMIVGGIREKRIDVKLSGDINFSSIDKIAGIPISGKGKVIGSVSGLLEKAKFRFDLKQQRLRVMEYFLNQAAAIVTYSLDDNTLKIRELSGKNESLDYRGDADFSFIDKEFFNIKIDYFKGELANLFETANPLLNTLESIKNKYDIYSQIRGFVNVSGPYRAKDITASGEIFAKNISILNEDIKILTSPFTYENETVSFPKIKGSKGGMISGSFSYNLPTKVLNYVLTLGDANLKDFYYFRLLDLGLNSKVKLKTSGNGEIDKLESNTEISLYESKVASETFKDSNFTFVTKGQNLVLDGVFSGGDISLKGNVNLDKRKNKRSRLILNYKVDDIRKYLSIFSLHNVKSVGLGGQVEGNFDSDFNFSDLSDMNLSAQLSNFAFRYDNISIEKKNEPQSVLISKGYVKSWDVNLKSNRLELRSIGRGSVGKNLSIDTIFNVDASILELTSNKIERSQGKIEGFINLKSFTNDLIPNARFVGNGLTLKVEGIRGSISDVNFETRVENNIATLEYFKGKYGNGNVSSKGTIGFKFPSPLPIINIKNKLEKVSFPVLKKSDVILSGTLNFTGEKFPYLAEGNLSIEEGNILEGMQDLAQSAAKAESYKRFLPIGYSRGGQSPLMLNIDTFMKGPILIKNGMVDVELGGRVKIRGTPLSPLFQGNLSVVDQTSKLVFKGHEFFLRDGEIRLLDNRIKEKPEVNLVGVARVNDYDVYVTVAGAVDNLSIELSSNPVLSQEDILSLLTLGVTSDVTKSLNENEMRSVTNLSIGSLIVDQLKINQTLNDSLGLRLSVEPEFQENNQNLLDGRTEGSSGDTRLRSTTRIKVRKKITSDVNMSVSSTLGGTIEQSQEMNINYNVNKNFSLEGVYQIQSGQEIDIETPDSFGMDLKWQWSF